MQNSETEIFFDIVANEVGISKDELDGRAEFADLGVDDILAKSILSKAADIGLCLPDSTFSHYPTVDSLRSHLRNSSKHSIDIINHGKTNSFTSNPNNPLSTVIQGQTASAKTMIFLLPDGSGSAMAYLRLPAVGPGICLIGLNSPFLNGCEKGKFSIEGMAAVWGDEIMLRQPDGPYILGGWSAGGYYSFEVAKYLICQNRRVKKLVLIDSPCRLVYEELPMEVVHYLSKNNLMGNWGPKQPPTWMINHFKVSIRSISDYIPTPMKPPGLPEVFIIWAKEGVLKNADDIGTGLDLNVKVTKMLLQRPDTDGPLGWDRLFPGTKLYQAKIPGNHFTIVFPPDCKSLSILLNDIAQDRALDSKSLWQNL